MDIRKSIKKQLNSDIQRIISELSRTIAELKKDNPIVFDPVISKLEQVIRIWKSEEEAFECLRADS